MLEIQKFLKERPITWREELVKEPYCLKIQEEAELICFKYNQISSDFSQPIVQECRGIILEKNSWKVICHGFDKFFNYGETYAAKIDESSTTISQKIDGSLIKLYFYKGQWRLATNGRIDAFKTPISGAINASFGQIFENALRITYNMDWHEFLYNAPILAHKTYMFELVSPETQVIIRYPEPKIYYLNERDNLTGREENNWEQWMHIVSVPKQYTPCSLDELVVLAKELPDDEEGYVVCDKNFNRVKVKSPKYFYLHRMVNNHCVSTGQLIEAIENNDCEELLLYCPEYSKKVEEIRQKFDYLSMEAKECLSQMKEKTYTSQKEWAKEVMQQKKYLQDFLFKNYSVSLSWEEYFSKIKTSTKIQLLSIL